MKIKKIFTLLLTFLISGFLYADYLAPSTTNPGGFSNGEVPQLIIIGSDDNSSASAMRWMVSELASRTNKDGTPLRMSFYSNTSYWNGNSNLLQAHKEAYAAKHELANHTVDHPYCIQHQTEWDPKTPIVKWWTTDELVTQQIQPVIDALISQVGVDPDDIYGFRTPFLGFSDNTFEAMAEVGTIYDCSIGEGGDAGNYYWPYTLDNYPPGLPNWWTSQELHNVTLSSYENLWELPAYNIEGPTGPIGGLDYNLWAGTNSGGFALNKQQSIDALKSTLYSIYTGNRTPYTYGVHSQMYEGTESDFPNITAEADRKAVFTAFLDYAISLDNVWFVTGAQAINYCRQPVKASEFNPDDYLPENFNSNGETKYTLTVVNGIGGGDFVEGAIKTISADDPATGKQFDKWTGDVSTIADVNASTTTITIGTSAITVTATYKDAVGPDTTDASDNFTTYEASDSGWQIGSIDELGSTGSVSKPSDAVVSADFTFSAVDTSLGDDGYPYGSIAYYDNPNFKDVNYIKVTYKSPVGLNIVLEQKAFTAGGAHQKTLAKSDNFTTVLLEVNSTNFTQPDWWLAGNDAVALDMATMNGVSFEPEIPDEGGSIAFEISELIFYGYDDGTPITSVSNSFVKQMAINNVNARTMNISIPQSGKYSLAVYSLDGSLISKIAEKNFNAGTYNVNWNGSDLSSQMYLISLKGAGIQSVRKAFIK